MGYNGITLQCCWEEVTMVGISMDAFPHSTRFLRTT